jgi:hypothetical protein
MKANHLLVLISLCTLAPHAAAVGPLATDPNALPSWRGSLLFTGASADNLVRADVDFAVFAPGASGPASVPGEYI